ncbi:MAG: hypothetical protein ACOX8Q_10280 [Christensenellales bacterium]
MDIKMQRYYKKKIYGGRSLIARTVDFLLLRAFIFFIIFIFILYLSLSTTVALLMSIFITIAISLMLQVVKRKKTDGFIKKDLERLKQKCLLEMLTLMDKNEYAEYINKIFDYRIKDAVFIGNDFKATYKDYGMYVFHNHPNSLCGVEDTLNIYRLFKDKKKIIIISLSEFSEDAKRLSAMLPAEFDLISGQRILNIANEMGMMPDEKNAEENVKKEMNDTIVTLKKIRKAAFSKAKIKSYIICGIVIMFWPFITGFRIYYPIIAIVCFVLAFITYKKSNYIEESSDIGIS